MLKSQNLDLFLRIYFNLSPLLSFFPLPFLFISSFVAHFIVLVKCMELWQWNWQWIYPKMLPFLVSVTLTGLVRISKMRYRWKDLHCVSLKLLLFINLYPASRGPLIFLDKSGRLKRSIAWRDKTRTILKPWTNRVSKHENRVSSFEKLSFFILTTRKDFRKQFISWET